MLEVLSVDKSNQNRWGEKSTKIPKASSDAFSYHEGKLRDKK